MKEEKVQFHDIPFKFDILSIKRYPIHWHKDVTEIIMPIKGSVVVYSNFENFTIDEGDFLFINNKTIHAIQSDNDALIITFHIDLNYFEDHFPYIKYMFFRSHFFPIGPNGENLIPDVEEHIKEEFKINFRKLLVSTMIELTNPNFKSDMLIKNFVYKLVYLMVYEFNWLQFQRKHGDFISSVQLDRYHRIVKFIDENYSSKISLDDIVSQEFISKTYISHFWKNISFYSFVERVAYERVLKSAYLLFQDMTISDISNACGFSDVKYYYRDFKRWYGYMPLEYKEKCILYTKQGPLYTSLDFFDVEEEFDNYLSDFFEIEYTPKKDIDISSFTEEYLYLKYFNKANNLKYPIAKTMIINPFKFYKNNEENIAIFNWDVLDILMNLAIELDVTVQIKFDGFNVKKDLINDHIEKFIETSINRYGIDIVKSWHFSIPYYSRLAFNNLENIGKFLASKVKEPIIDYYLEP